MNENNIFLGLNGFVWWVGVVEDRGDPLHLGRCRIRIFGWHTDNKQLIPTGDLPWAQPVLPPNNSKTFTTPTEGDWVVGFFFDGPAGQVPVYFGVLPGIPAPYSNNPQKGFSDPRTDSQLAASPALPKTNTIESDGSGTTTVNQPAQRNPNPSTVGYPNTNLLAINDITNPPPSIAQRLADLTTKITGPNSQSLSTAIAGAAQGAAAALQGIAPSLQALVPSATSLANSIVPTVPNLSDATAQAQALLNAQSQTLAQSQESVSSQIASAQESLAKAQAEAQASLSVSMNDLKSKAADIANQLSSKLSSLTPANISTKTPVNLINNAPNADLGAVAPGPLVNTYAPNPIPAEIPLEKIGSTLQKSSENMISLFEQTLTQAYSTVGNVANSNEVQNLIISLQQQTGTIADAMNDPNVKAQLDAFALQLR